MIDHLPPETGGDGLLREIVIGGAEAAGGDDDIHPLLCDVQRLRQPFRVVPYDGMIQHIDADGGKALREELCVRVGDAAEQ